MISLLKRFRCSSYPKSIFGRYVNWVGEVTRVSKPGVRWKESSGEEKPFHFSSRLRLRCNKPPWHWPPPLRHSSVLSWSRHWESEHSRGRNINTKQHENREVLMMNVSNCSLECGSSAGTKEAAEFYLEKVGKIMAFVWIGKWIIYFSGRSPPGRDDGTGRQHCGHRGVKVGGN